MGPCTRSMLIRSATHLIPVTLAILHGFPSPVFAPLYTHRAFTRRAHMITQCLPQQMRLHSLFTYLMRFCASPRCAIRCSILSKPWRNSLSSASSSSLSRSIARRGQLPCAAQCCARCAELCTACCRSWSCARAAVVVAGAGVCVRVQALPPQTEAKTVLTRVRVRV